MEQVRARAALSPIPAAVDHGQAGLAQMMSSLCA